MNSMVKRIISGIVLAMIAFPCIALGGIFSLCFITLLGVGAYYELVRALGFLDKQKDKAVLSYIGIFLSVVMYMLVYFIDYRYAIIGTIMVNMIAVLTIYVLKFNKYSINDVALLMFSFLYTSVVGALMMVLRLYMKEGQYLVWLAIIPAICCDIFAYFVGVLIGKHHFSKVSPKKTIEGCVGGIVGAALGTGVYGYILSSHINASEGFVVACVVMGIVCGFISMIGDLAASAIKREVGIKDYGKIIPGHGGFLDRLDSILFITPIVYLGVLLLNTFYM